MGWERGMFQFTARHHQFHILKSESGCGLFRLQLTLSIANEKRISGFSSSRWILCHSSSLNWRFPEMRVPPNHPVCSFSRTSQFMFFLLSKTWLRITYCFCQKRGCIDTYCLHMIIYTYSFILKYFDIHMYLYIYIYSDTR